MRNYFRERSWVVGEQSHFSRDLKEDLLDDIEIVQRFLVGEDKEGREAVALAIELAKVRALLEIAEAIRPGWFNSFDPDEGSDHEQPQQESFPSAEPTNP